jgi:hypothetical protein
MDGDDHQATIRERVMHRHQLGHMHHALTLVSAHLNHNMQYVSIVGFEHVVLACTEGGLLMGLNYNVPLFTSRASCASTCVLAQAVVVIDGDN